MRARRSTDGGVVSNGIEAGQLHSEWWRRFGPAVALVVAMAAFLAGERAWHAWRNQAPYSAAAVNAHISVKVVAPEAAQAELDRLAGRARMWAIEPADELRNTTQELVGQLAFDVPVHAPATGEYALFIIDKRSNQVTPSLFGIGPPGSNVGQGWDSLYNPLASRYRWLAPTAMINASDGTGWHAPGMAIEFPPDTGGPVTFVGTLNSALPITDPASQLTIGLAFFGSNGTLYWAEQLAAT